MRGKNCWQTQRFQSPLIQNLDKELKRMEIQSNEIKSKANDRKTWKIFVDNGLIHDGGGLQL